MSAAAQDRIRAYPWRGNVREVKNELQRAFIMSDKVLEFSDLIPGRDGAALPADVGGSLEESERKLILATLGQVGGDKKQAAQILGISLKTLYNRLHLYADS